MKTFKFSGGLAAVFLLALGALTGCQSTGGGGYYGPAQGDLWFYGQQNYNYNVVAAPPPPGRPPEQGLHPAHPIASPPQITRPSIPSTPRPAPRGGGRSR